MKFPKDPSEIGVTDLGTLLSKQAEAAKQAAADNAGDVTERVVQLLTPTAEKVRINTLNVAPDGRIDIVDFRAEFADGTAIHAPHITITAPDAG